MKPHNLIWTGAIVGSIAGGFIPEIWGSDMLSFSSIIFSTVGGLAGIWLGFKLSQTI